VAFALTWKFNALRILRECRPIHVESEHSEILNFEKPKFFNKETQISFRINYRDCPETK
jgi:hypothetical protein